jgi:hypothetical protein
MIHHPFIVRTVQQTTIDGMNAWLYGSTICAQRREKLTRGHHCADVVSTGVVIKRVGEKKEINQQGGLFRAMPPIVICWSSCNTG